MTSLKLRYEIDSPDRLREHIHLVDGVGYFFFAQASAEQGTPAALEVVFSSLDQAVSLRGSVWAKPATGGVWLELPKAVACLDQLKPDLAREVPRSCTEQLVLAEPQGMPALLCRLLDVSEGGARLSAAAEDFGRPGQELRMALPEAGLSGGQLEAFGRVAWVAAGEIGVQWYRGDLTSRAAVLRLLQLADDEWASARASSHGTSCRCMKQPAVPPVLLLG
jgi:PilZ domain